MHYSEATDALDRFRHRARHSGGETQAGKSALPHDHPLNLGAIGVTGTSAANQAAEAADVILAVGTRLQDFTTGSWALFRHPHRQLIGLNVQAFDAAQASHAAAGRRCARRVSTALEAALGGYRAPDAWRTAAGQGDGDGWQDEAAAVTAPVQCRVPVGRAGDRRGAARRSG